MTLRDEPGLMAREIMVVCDNKDPLVGQAGLRTRGSTWAEVGGHAPARPLWPQP